MPKIDLAAVPKDNSSRYLPPYHEPMGKRWNQRLAPAAGITDFGVNLIRVEPGGISSQRHWHEGEDEFVVILSGHAVLVDDHGRTPLGPGDCAAFPKGGNGHQLLNEGTVDCVMVAVGLPMKTPCHYPDIDLYNPGDGTGFRRKG
ncbi:cupin domain-containing protein [Sphingomonas nostoxanthinifaciens]|uniref:cupin domain-containing protein n=1 Tax=Sphingomonas nostoxanthinifaciens TaxID=2872652 RepID=UPI001CC2159C|nr:cupin domain-containing protein [Sphingomonas nostoxanthinifaciens]UAK24227.1 cupin domain-containing protein [Sphingomonas nostoxanthinifaciens]